MERCPVCGGAATCPAGRYEVVERPSWDEILHLPRNAQVPEGYTLVNATRRHIQALPTRKGDLELLLAGSAESGRIRAHYGVEGLWVRQCTLAFYVRRRKG